MNSPKRRKKFVIPQMFDVRPVDKTGDLDWKKMSGLDQVIRIKHTRKKIASKQLPDFPDRNISTSHINIAEAQRFADEIKKEHKRHRYASGSAGETKHPKEGDSLFFENKNIGNAFLKFGNQDASQLSENNSFFGGGSRQKTSRFPPAKKRKPDIGIGEIFSQARILSLLKPKKTMASFSLAGIAILMIIFSAAFLSKSMSVKENSLINGQMAFASLEEAKNEIKNKDFKRSQIQFSQAYDHLNDITDDTNSLGIIIVEASKYIPYASKLASGAHLAAAGKNISEIGVISSRLLNNMEIIKGGTDQGDDRQISYLKIFQETDNDLKQVTVLVGELEENLDDINPDDVPEGQREKFLQLKAKLPEAQKFLNEFLGYEKIFTDILGGNGPRKYLFLLQNNQEIRATGGFIGTYAVLDIFNGHVRNFFIDGIFNPDGQLMEKVVPPSPIQKISAAWSLHDSNWFPDFPVSAQKASWFYEHTGGPTVDGIITMTPNVVEKLLGITGPIEMPDYNTTIDKENFFENIETEVEYNYDKELNQPKRILSDLAPKVLEKIFNEGSVTQMAKTMNILVESLNERHILIYSNNFEIEKALSDRGWSGEVLDTAKDYLMVVNTNINGYKTDGVVDENIDHKAEIQTDGSIVDTVTITRRHNGGDTPFDFYNKVNADYMRVYVPKGSQLISASGQTREYNTPPLDYGALGFRRDAQVEMEESSMKIDEASGTKIYDDAGKTVFANWVYVSPKETVKLTYKYILPFKVGVNQKNKPSDSFSVLFQKQSGTAGSKLSSAIIFPKYFTLLWNYPERSITRFDDGDQTGIKTDTVLTTDKFSAIAITQ